MTDLGRIKTAVRADGLPSSDFDLNPDITLAEGRKLRDAAVLVPLLSAADGLHVVLTKRSSALQHHPGQIAFPGGKRDQGDVDMCATALREAEEEIGLPRDHVEVFGALPVHETVTGFRVTPIIGHVSRTFTPVPERGEVDEVFSVPLSHLAVPERFAVQGRIWQGSMRNYYTVPYGPYYIWGATARILRSFAGLLQ